MNGAESVPTGYGLYLLQTLLALGAVCLLAYVVLRVLARRIHGLGRKGRLVRVVEHLPLDQRRSLYVVEAGGRTLLLGASEAGIGLVAELERASEQAGAGEEAADPTTTREDRSPGPG